MATSPPAPAPDGRPLRQRSRSVTAATTVLGSWPSGRRELRPVVDRQRRGRASRAPARASTESTVRPPRPPPRPPGRVPPRRAAPAPRAAGRRGSGRVVRRLTLPPGWVAPAASRAQSRGPAGQSGRPCRVVRIWPSGLSAAGAPEVGPRVESRCPARRSRGRTGSASGAGSRLGRRAPWTDRHAVVAPRSESHQAEDLEGPGAARHRGDRRRGRRPRAVRQSPRLERARLAVSSCGVGDDRAHRADRRRAGTATATRSARASPRRQRASPRASPRQRARAPHPRARTARASAPGAPSPSPRRRGAPTPGWRRRSPRTAAAARRGRA